MDRCSYEAKCTLNRLENIEEEKPSSCWFPTLLPKPETPTESMDFLARSWSLSSLELSKALSDAFLQSHHMESSPCTLGMEIDHTSATTSFQVAKVSTNSDPCLLQPFAAVESNGGTGTTSNPIPFKETEDVKDWLLALDPDLLSKQRFLGNQSVGRGKSMSRWLKDQKDKKKEEIRTHNAQLHAAASVAGVAAAVAAIVAATSTSSETSAVSEGGISRISVAVASAAALVASHCVEIAEEMGADRNQIQTIINSAVNVKTTGDIMTLTAGAATALRGAATLRARLHKEIPSPTLNPRVESIPQEEKHDEAYSALDFVTRGGELLKRTRKGVRHWKQVSLHINSNGQVVIKMKSKHMAGTFMKKKKSVVFDLCNDVPAWDGRDGEEGGQQRAYFGIRTVDRLIEFECRDKHDKQMWVDGIQHMLQYRGTQIKPCHSK